MLSIEAGFMIKFMSRFYPYIPIIGMGLFLVIFTIAALDYPGGSDNIPEYVGYSFFHNFLCDVMDPFTDGGVNPARPLAIVAHIILSVTMMAFFYVLPEIFDWQNRNTNAIRYMGMLSMAVLAFMFTPAHDHIVTATGILGTFALIPFFLEMRRYPNGRLKQLAYLCFALSVVVFFIFETKFGFYYLPFLQKITFVFDAWWVIWVSLIVLRKNQSAVSS